jgi:7,8-dihydropterin-6-yl-methyl-4-(beta-D-ribofuranosyl)aminobenzene 5'-phosphate synthase
MIKEKEMFMQRQLMNALSVLVGLLLGFVSGVIGVLSLRFILGRQRADDAWQAARYPKMRDLGTVRKLSVLPIIDWYAVDRGAGLATEPGVSYLLQADDTTLLFDVGFNRQHEHPSPLLRNLETLGKSLADLDMMVISHAHLDHVGGKDHADALTFAPSGQPVELSGLPVYTPDEPLTNPTAETVVVNAPQKLASGVATMGPIARQLFFDGWRPEQSLAIRVAGKGLVLVIGCGHPTIQRIVARAEMLFDEPVYAVIGGLHYPVTESRAQGPLGLPLQSFFGTGKFPWDPINKDDVAEAITFLQERQPKLVSLSPHDSCDWTLNAFQKAFGPAYQPLFVGQEIIINEE